MKPQKLQKIVTRFYYPITLEFWFRGATEELKRVTGEAFTDVIIRFDGKKAEVFRIAKELNTKIKQAMMRYIRTDDFFNGVPAYKRLVQRYDNARTRKDASLEEVGDLFVKLYPLFAVAYYVSNLWLDDVPEGKRKKVIELSKQYRELSDGILNKLDVFVVDFLRKNNLPSFTLLKDLKSKRKPRRQLDKGFIFSRGNFLDMSWSEFLQHNNYTYEEESVGFSDVLTGMSACPGKARGIAKIVFSPSDFGKISKGTILVTPMTQPTFTPVLSKVIAIITDEGGITSHAAIVSRELKRPCIIGTKIATKVLKDGDLVEVDADNGEVKILKRA